MPRRANRTCPRCHTKYRADRCPTCRERDTAMVEARRPSSTQRGYGSKWGIIRAAFLKAHPTCCIPGCGAPAEVPDHHPVSRAELVAQGDPHPDAWARLRPLCLPCHRRETARNQPGGWNRPGYQRW